MPAISSGKRGTAGVGTLRFPWNKFPRSLLCLCRTQTSTSDVWYISFFSVEISTKRSGWVLNVYVAKHHGVLVISFQRTGCGCKKAHAIFDSWVYVGGNLYFKHVYPGYTKPLAHNCWLCIHEFLVFSGCWHAINWVDRTQCFRSCALIPTSLDSLLQVNKK